ncbi:MAG: type II and III secretion system protein family protein [Kiloniellaceae bacterium]
MDHKRRAQGATGGGWVRAVLLSAAAWGLVLAGAGSGWAQARPVVLSDDSKHAGEFVVPVDKSQVLRLDVPFAELMIGNPEIADVMALTDRSIYALGKSPGSTSLMIYGRDKRLLAVVDVVVSPDIEGLKKKLFELLPGEAVEVRALNGSVVLSGAVSSAGRMAKVLAVAERFAPGRVTNLLSVKGSQQVMLKVRFVEVSRTALKRFGLNFDILEGDFSFTSGDAFLANPEALAGVSGFTLSGESFGAGLFSGTVGTVGLQLLFEALETKGMAKTLAEPNLIALSGDTASFLAGGEFPIEVAQSGASATGEAAITIEFKEFGISLSFTPTVLDEGLINLVVSPEVSALDFSVTVNGTPGLTTRRATTTIELRDGQAFAIAGLLQEDFQDTVRQVPLLGDVPVLGALFRSSQFQRNETELVIIVEPHLVKPAPAGSLATPIDRFIPPGDLDLLLFGRIEAPGSGSSRKPGNAALHAAGIGGIDGRFGHIIK